MDFIVTYLNTLLGGLAALAGIVSIYYLIREMQEQNRVARANARQNVSDSHQEIALKGMTPRMVKIKIKLTNIFPENKDGKLTHNLIPDGNMILFIGGPVDWEGGPVDWRAWET